MDRTPTSKTGPEAGDGKGRSREGRLKSALKANLARRKAQARARQQGGDAGRGSTADGASDADSDTNPAPHTDRTED